MKDFSLMPCRRLWIICLLLVCLGIVGAALFSIWAALILLFTAGGILLIWRLAARAQENALLAVADEIDKLLHGEETLFFSDTHEGAMGVLNAEVRKLTIELREQNTQLRESHVFMKMSLEDISHQLRTPLTSMMLLVNLLSKHSLTDEKRMEYVKELANLNARMQWLIETLLKLSRLDAGVVKFRKEPVSCAELLSAAKEPLMISAELKGVEIVTESCGNAAFQGDFERSVEAVSNILKNCIEHTPSGGCVTLSAEENNIYTQIVIADTGAGISAEDMPHIFERFYQSSDFAKNGYGIGLAFAKQTIQGQNGILMVKNAQPHGAVFELRIYRNTV